MSQRTDRIRTSRRVRLSHLHLCIVYESKQAPQQTPKSSQFNEQTSLSSRLSLAWFGINVSRSQGAPPASYRCTVLCMAR